MTSSPNRPHGRFCAAQPKDARQPVCTAAAGAASEEEFFARLRDSGVLVRIRYSVRDPGQVTGYAVALSSNTARAGPWPGVPVRGRNALGRAQACWLAILPVATPYFCRHGRETCMDNHGVQKVLWDLVMGHRTARLAPVVFSSWRGVYR